MCDKSVNSYKKKKKERKERKKRNVKTRCLRNLPRWRDTGIGKQNRFINHTINFFPFSTTKFYLRIVYLDFFVETYPSYKLIDLICIPVPIGAWSKRCPRLQFRVRVLTKIRHHRHLVYIRINHFLWFDKLREKDGMNKKEDPRFLLDSYIFFPPRATFQL